MYCFVHRHATLCTKPGQHEAAVEGFPCSILQYIKLCDSTITIVMKNLTIPYTCCCCNFQSRDKNDMRRHLYGRKKKCPKTMTDIELTDDVKEYILENRVYRDTNDDKPVRQCRGGLRASVRYALWNRDFGETNGTGQCACCKRVITQQSFHAGHIVAKVHQGNDALSNLVPLCAACNQSMGSVNFHDFVATYFASAE